MASSPRISSIRRFSATSSIIAFISLVVIIFLLTISVIILISGDMARYSTLINETGKIRGGIQRAVKMEIAGSDSDAAIALVDELIAKAQRIQSGRFLKFKEFREYEGLIAILSERWTLMHREIEGYRRGSVALGALVKDSEVLWSLADSAVSTVEQTSHFNVILYYILAVVGGLGIVILLAALVTTKIIVHDRIEYLADHAQLTGAYNRHYFNRMYQREFLLARRSGRAFGLLMCDLDRFKAINDRYGHDAGDDVLRSLSRTIRELSRETDLFARFGGEEFVILTMDEKPEHHRLFAERIRKAVEETVAIREQRVTISIGVAAYREGATMDGLLKAADEALYRAKAAGRNRVENA